MNIKVGQWVRRTDNKFILVSEILNSLVVENGNNGVWIKDIIKVADTPQELIEVGDLVRLKGINNIYEIRFEGSLHKWFLLDIVKILTPNGKDYICQWEATNE